MSKVDEQLLQIIATGSTETLLSSCEEYEISFANDANFKHSNFFYAAFLLGYLTQMDFDNARFLWKRIPKDNKSSSKELALLWSVGQFMWKREHAQVYKQLTSQQWSSALKSLVDQLIVNYRANVLGLFGRAYATINPVDLSVVLGLSLEDTKKFVCEQGWTYDEQTQFYAPSKAAQKSTQGKSKSGLEVMGSLAERTLFLELNNS